MKHTICQHGQLTQIDCELGSGIFDKNGKEIFEGDIVEDSDGERSPVYFHDAAFFLSHDRLLGDYIISDLEVVGHVED